jgi:hypothetical protein
MVKAAARRKGAGNSLESKGNVRQDKPPSFVPNFPTVWKNDAAPRREGLWNFVLAVQEICRTKQRAHIARFE